MSNLVTVISVTEIDSELKSLMGEIIDKEEKDIVGVEFQDLVDKTQKVIADFEKNGNECFVGFEINK